MSDLWKPPTTMAKIQGFLVAYRDWAAAGYPRREPAWVKEIFETHCTPCEMYEPESRTLFGSVGVCGRCGCHVSADGEDMLNKIVMPTQGCPLDPPKFRASVEWKDSTPIKGSQPNESAENRDPSDRKPTSDYS